MADKYVRKFQIDWLAQELFSVRNDVLDEQFPWIQITRSYKDPAHKAVYTALATFIIDFADRQGAGQGRI